MAEHSLDELKRQLEAATSRAQAAAQAQREAQTRYNEAVRQSYIDSLAQQGIVLGKTVVEVPPAWRGDKTPIGLVSDVRRHWSAWEVVLFLRKQDGSIGRREHRVSAHRIDSLQIIEQIEP